jgi:hypothetical protein
MTELQRVRSGDLDVVLLSPDDALREGKDTVTIEFRSASDQSLLDVGTVKASASMSMAGMPMLGGIQLEPTDVKGRYTANTDLGMAGTWRMTMEWDGPARRGSVSFSATAQ